MMDGPSPCPFFHMFHSGLGEKSQSQPCLQMVVDQAIAQQEWLEYGCGINASAAPLSRQFAE